MGLNDFTMKRLERVLPIFILADTSGSMEGEKITKLNNALREMVSTLAGIDDIRGSFQVCIITFGHEVKVHQALTDVKKISLDELNASGRTPMGEAIELLISIIENKSLVPLTAYTPTIVLISDGLPTDINVEDAKFDDYMIWEPIKKLCSNKYRASKCLRLAMGVGKDTDQNMLKAFINNDSIHVFKSNEAAGIEQFFKWVTMSTISRITSTNPNEVSLFYPVDTDTDDFPI